MPANGLSLSMGNAVFIYSLLALYGLTTLLIVRYVNAKFRAANKTLKLLTAEWATAESRHADFVGAAQEQIAKLTAAPPVVHQPVVRSTAVGFDTRNQAVAMAKRGISVPDIAKASRLHEGEVEVLLGMARLQRM